METNKTFCLSLIHNFYINFHLKIWIISKKVGVILRSQGVNHAVQNLDYCSPYYMDGTYNLLISIPRQVFNKDYPINPKTFGERLRKAPMDSGFQIRKFAEIIGITEDTVINWEIRGMRPLRRQIKEMVDLFLMDSCFEKLI